MTGRLIAVVGPSGVGKDSLIAALCAARPALVRVRRTVTRDEKADLGEPIDRVTPEDFARLARDGAFCLDWEAHGLRYGIPRQALDAVRAGQDAVANLSRGQIEAARRVFPALVVLNLTARPEALADRLGGRARETAAEIAARLARTAPLPEGVDRVDLSNDGALADTVAAALCALDLQPVAGR